MSAERPALQAPTLDAVDIVIEGADEPSACKREADGWWRSPVALEPGTHYRFRLRSRSWFQEGELVEVPDPEARSVSPDGAWAVVPDDSPAAFAWQHDDEPLPGPETMSIYELYVQDFNDPGGGGGFGDVIAGLDHIADLGITSIELLPVTHPGDDTGWGYTPRFPFAVAPRFGTRMDLARLVDEAHARSMRVILDLVYNHADVDAPLAQIDHDCWFHHEPKDPEHAWGPQFDFGSVVADADPAPGRAFVERHLREVIQLYHIDGIRLDAVYQMDNDDFLTELCRQARHWATDKPFACIAECSPIRPAIVGPGGAVDASWHDGFCRTIRALLIGEWPAEELPAAIDPRLDGFQAGIDVVRYLASHDHGHLLRHLLDHAIGEDDALRRAALGYALLLTTPGRPMLWMGEEFGAAQAVGEAAEPLSWHLLDEDERRQDLHARIRWLLQARRRHGALRGDGCELLACDEEQRLLACYRWDEAGGRFLILAHPGDGALDVRLAVPEAGRWYRCNDPDDDQVLGDEEELACTLEAWQAQIYRLVEE